MCNPVTTSNPDALLAKGAHAGFEWEVTANGIGYRCGYVRLPQGHPWHGKDYDDEALWGVRVHGGLTFAAPDTHCGKGGEDDAPGGFNCIHEWRRWFDQRDEQGIYGGDHRRGGVDQPGGEYESQDLLRSPGDRAEAGFAGFKHLQGPDRMARGDLGSRFGSDDLPAAPPPSPDSLRLASEKHDGSINPAGSAAVHEDQSPAGAAGRHDSARYCAECGRVPPPDGGYWLGFDCAHAGDAPDGSLRGQDSREVADLYGMFDGSFSRFGTVKTTEYVAAECRRLAEQAANELVPGSWPTEDQ
jgi:hypothetical protein